MKNFIAAVIVIFFCLACFFLIVWGAFNHEPATMAMGWAPILSAGTGLITYYFGQKQGEARTIMKYGINKKENKQMACVVYVPDEIFVPPLDPKDFRKASKLRHPMYETDQFDRQEMEQDIVNAMAGLESPELSQLNGLCMRILLARAMQGLPYRSLEAIKNVVVQDVSKYDNVEILKAAVIHLDKLRVFGLPVGTLPPVLDDVYDQCIEWITNPPEVHPTDVPE